MRVIWFGAPAVAVLLFSGCGWKIAETPLSITGQVIEADSGDPLEEAYIDIADDKEKLDFAITTDLLTDEEGRFDTVYRYPYEKWMWLGLPVYWFPTTPERLYVEAAKKGYRSRVVEVDCGALKPTAGKAPPPIQLDPIRLRKNLPRGRFSRRSERGEE
jgi:hypothetical protein